jgi:hypothetical protein
MSRTSEDNRPARPTPPHKAVVAHARSMRRVLAAIVATWNVRATVREVVEQIPRESAPLPGSLHIIKPDGQVTRPGEAYQWTELVYGDRKRRPDEYPQADSTYWAELWKAAVHLRDMADRLAAYAQREGRLAREHAHPANRAVVSHPPEEQP